MALELGVLLAGVAEGVFVVAGVGGLHFRDVIYDPAGGPGAGEGGRAAEEDFAGETVGGKHDGEPAVQIGMVADRQLRTAAVHDFFGVGGIEAGFPLAGGGEVLEISFGGVEAVEWDSRGEQRARAAFILREDVGVVVVVDGGGGGVGVRAVGDEREVGDIPFLGVGAEVGDAGEVAAAGLERHGSGFYCGRVADAEQRDP